MKHRRLRLGCVVAVVALVAAGCGSSRTASAPKPGGSGNPIERAFARLLTEQHPEFRGPSACPSLRVAHGNAEPQPCIAEMHRGKDYIQVWAYPARRGPVAFHHPFTRTWTRRWSRYAPNPQGVTPGLISVNADGFDWRWLLLGVDYECRQKHRTTCTAGALDGSFNGYPVMFDFRCHDRGPLIACRNALGDAIRWRPHASGSGNA